MMSSETAELFNSMIEAHLAAGFRTIAPARFRERLETWIV